MFEMIEYIPVEQIHPHPDNPRKALGDLAELTASIRENGVLQNLTVISDGGEPETFTVIIGHRRLAAAKAAGLTKVPCIVVDMERDEAVKTMLVENMQRSDLTVYEQAQGFQMMLDLGVPVEEIARRSGFSETTVRRRVKMAELDPETLKEVSSRQLNLGDFDALAEIKDIKARNTALKAIGTNDFGWALNQALIPQKQAENRPKVKAWLKSVGAQKIPREDLYGAGYESYPGADFYISIANWDEAKIPEKITEPVYYYMDEDHLRLMKKSKKPPKEKKLPEEIEREKAIDEAWAELVAAGETAYMLRRNFVEKLIVTQKNRADILMGAVYAGALQACCYNGSDRDAIREILGVKGFGSQAGEEIHHGMNALKGKDLPKLVYALFGDSENEMCVTYKAKSLFPKYDGKAELEILYIWLADLGYVMSTEESELLFGTHEAYRAEETFEANTAK